MQLMKKLVYALAVPLALAASTASFAQTTTPARRVAPTIEVTYPTQGYAFQAALVITPGNPGGPRPTGGIASKYAEVGAQADITLAINWEPNKTYYTKASYTIGLSRVGYSYSAGGVYPNPDPNPPTGSNATSWQIVNTDASGRWATTFTKLLPSAHLAAGAYTASGDVSQQAVSDLQSVFSYSGAWSAGNGFKVNPPSPAEPTPDTDVPAHYSSDPTPPTTV